MGHRERVHVRLPADADPRVRRLEVTGAVPAAARAGSVPQPRAVPRAVRVGDLLRAIGAVAFDRRRVRQHRLQPRRRRRLRRLTSRDPRTSGVIIGRTVTSSRSGARRDHDAIAPPDAKGRVLTGFRPTGPMHIGHWFGNVMNMIRLQQDHEAFYFLADWHMLTTHYDRTKELPENVRMLALDLVAAGVDPNRVTFYRQSDVKEVAELTLLL